MTSHSGIYDDLIYNYKIDATAGRVVIPQEYLQPNNQHFLPLENVRGLHVIDPKDINANV